MKLHKLFAMFTIISVLFTSHFSFIADTLPFAVKINKGCLFSEVFKVLYLSADSKLVNLTAGTRMSIEARTVLDREWLSLREYYAAMRIVQCCERYQVRQPCYTYLSIVGCKY